MKLTVAQVKNALIKRRASLLASLKGELQKLVAKDDHGVGDQMDLVVDTEYSEVCSQLAECESREVENIDNALTRIKRGKYGVCESCDGKIPVARLQALPYVTRCVKCQQSEDRRGSAADASWKGSRMDFLQAEPNNYQESRYSH